MVVQCRCCSITFLSKNSVLDIKKDIQKVVSHNDEQLTNVL